MAPDSQQYTAFTFGNLGFHEFTCMPFGLCNAPATFQHLMQNSLGELSLRYCVIYLDNVIVFGQTKEEHPEHLHIMFKWFCEFNLKLKPSKSSFSNQRLFTWLTMSHKRESAPVRTMYAQLRSFPCLKPILRSMPSVDLQGITGTLSRDLPTLHDLFMMYWGRRSRWDQYNCLLRHMRW